MSITLFFINWCFSDVHRPCLIVYMRIFIRDWRQAHLFFSRFLRIQLHAPPSRKAKAHEPGPGLRHMPVPCPTVYRNLWPCFFGHKCKRFLYSERKSVSSSLTKHISIHAFLCFLLLWIEGPFLWGPLAFKASPACVHSGAQLWLTRQCIAVGRTLSNSLMTLRSTYLSSF